jgi:phage tail sheath gpL-like
MSIPFVTTPADAVANATFVEVTKNKRAVGLQVVPQRVALIGRMDGAVTAFSEGDQLQVFSPDDVGKNFGFGSEIHLMSRGLLLGQSSFPVTVVALPSIEDVADTASAGDVTFTVSGLKAGTMAFYVGGDVYNISITAVDTPTTIAAALAAAITADANCPVSAVAALGVVDFTCNWKGSSGDDIILGIGFQKEEAVEGLTSVFTAMTGGVGETDAANVLAGIAEDDIFTQIVHNFTDATNLALIEAFETTRWAPGVKKGFCAYTGKRGTFSTATTLTAARNSFASAIIGTQGVPNYPHQVAAAYAAAFARSATSNPSKQLHTIELNNIIPPLIADRWTYTQRDSALKLGCATIKVLGGKTKIDQGVNTYQETGQGGTAPTIDRQITTVNLLIAVVYDQDTYFTNQWSTALLADDSPALPTGQKIMTPLTMKNELIARYRLYIAAAWVEDLDGYIDSLVTERDSVNRERMNAQQTITKIGNLRITAILIDYNFKIS